MMKKIMLLFALLLIPLVSAQETDSFWFYNSEYLKLNAEMTVNVRIVPEGPDPYMEELTINHSFLPLETYRQEITGISYTPSPKKTSDDSIVFYWETPAWQETDVKITTNILTKNTYKRIKKKIPFPLTNLPQEQRQYTKPGEIININDDIIHLASELAEGENDLVVVVDKIAAWVTENIQYNLTTTNIKASQSSTWVLRNKQGVCDELTSLFISMLRSLGIPARFVSGISYTNLEEFEDKWSGHGWAEVWFPDIGWVPYDATYGEYGWIDPSHITSKISFDSKEITTRFTWRGRDVTLEAEDLETEVKILDKGRKAPSLIDIDVEALKEKVDFGSYNLIIATIQNKQDFYVSTDIILSKTTGVNVIDNHKQHILLKPNEQRALYWIVKIDDYLDEKFVYTFPVMTYTLWNTTAEDEFSSQDRDPYYSKAEIEEILSLMKEEAEKTYSVNVNLDCSADEEYYEFEKPTINCRIKNIGNVLLKNLAICLESDCTTRILGISQEKQINFTVKKFDIGLNDVIITARNDQVSKSSQQRFTMLEKPKIIISEVQSPVNVSYEDQYAVEFLLEQHSNSKPVNVEIDFGQPGLKKEFHLEELEGKKRYIINLYGSDLSTGENRFEINILYKDKRDNEYTIKEELFITLNKPNFWQRIIIFFNDLEKKIREKF
jgi:hypothetical protein